MSVEQGLLITLAYVLGHSVGEITDITCCQLTTVKARVHQALDMFGQVKRV